MISANLYSIKYNKQLYEQMIFYAIQDIDVNQYNRHFVEYIKLLKALLKTFQPKPRILLTGDEFGRYFAINDPLQFFEMWKEVMELHAIDAIFVAHDVITQIIRKYQNPFGTADLYQLDYIVHEPLVDLVEKPTEEYDVDGSRLVRFKAEVVQEIERLTSGNVFYISDMCRKLIEYMNANEINLVNKLDLEICLKEWMTKSIESEFNIIGHPLFNAGEIGEEAISSNENIFVLNSIIDQKRNRLLGKNDDLYEVISRNYSQYIPSKERAQWIVESLLLRRVIKYDENTKQFYIRVRFYEEYLYDAFFKTFKGWRTISLNKEQFEEVQMNV